MEAVIKIVNRFSQPSPRGESRVGKTKKNIIFDSLINRFSPLAALMNNLGGIMIADTVSNQRHYPVIGIIADMRFQRVSHPTQTKSIKNGRDINIDIGNIDTQPGVQVFFRKALRNSITE